MSDNNKYVNLYIENTLGFVHQYLNEILQLKTQNRILNDLVSEKDQVINSLQDKLNKNVASNDKMSRVQANAKSMEDQYNAMKNKVSHMDTLLNQVNEMKRLIHERDNKIAELNIQIENLSSPKINKRRSKFKDVAASETETTTLPLNMSVASTETGSNDF